MNSGAPQVSVVMSVFNGARYLQESVESVLRQKGVDFEFIIINDGSTDESGRMLAEYAANDSRIRLFERDNQGLTLALIFGCNQARAPFIARQDVGDVYLPEKLAKQFAFLEANPDVGLLACGTRFVGPEHEFLYENVQSTQTLVDGLGALNIGSIEGPSSHTSVMVRTAAYQSVGGYRAEFRVAQDMDLWLRLAEHSEVASLAGVLTEVVITPESISGVSRQRQMNMGEILFACARQRKVGQSESLCLEQAKKLSAKEQSSARLAKAETNYFVARMLHNNGDSRCTKYYRRALRAAPFQWKYLARMLQWLLQSITGNHAARDGQL